MVSIKEKLYTTNHIPNEIWMITVFTNIQVIIMLRGSILINDTE